MTAKVAAELSFDTRKAEESMSRFGKLSKMSFTEMNQGLEIVGKAWSVVSGAIIGSVDYVVKWTAAAAESEQVQRKLQAAVGAQYEALSVYNAELANKLGIDDDDLAATQTKLIALGVQRSRLEDATKATLGLAAATDKDLGAATKKVAGAFAAGSVEAKKMVDLFVLAEEQASTFAGRTSALATAWGELDEVFGGVVTNSGALNQGIVDIKDLIVDFTSFLDSKDGQDVVDAFFRSIAGGVGNAINALIGMARVARDLKMEFIQIVDDMGGVTAEVGKALGSVELEKLGLESQMTAIREKMALNKQGEPEWWSKAADIANRFTAIGSGKRTARSGSGSGGRTGDDSENTKAAPNLAGGIAAPFDAPWARGMFSEADQAREEEAIAAREAMLDEQDARRLARLNAEIEEHDFYAKLRSEQRERELAREREFYGQLGSIGQSGVANFLSGTITEWASGEASLAEAAGRAFFGMLSQIGSGLVALGSSAVAAGILGSIAPIFAPATGGPAGVAAGLGLIAAGGTLMALGGAGSRWMGGGPRSAPATSTSGSGFSSAEPRGFVGTSSQAAPQTTVINVNLGRGYVTGTPREVGRELRDLIRQAGSLEPGWAR